MNIDVTDESAVRTVVSNFSNFWNRHDMAAMRELFSEDSELVNIVGMHWRGQAAVSKASLSSTERRSRKRIDRWTS